MMETRWFRSWWWRRHHKPWALRVTFLGGAFRFVEFDLECVMWYEYDRMTYIYRRSGDLVRMEAMHDGIVVGRWP